MYLAFMQCSSIHGYLNCELLVVNENSEGASDFFKGIVNYKQQATDLEKKTYRANLFWKKNGETITLACTNRFSKEAPISALLVLYFG